MSDKIKDLEWQISVTKDRITELEIDLGQLKQQLAAELAEFQINDIVEKKSGYLSGKYVIDSFTLSSFIDNYSVEYHATRLKKNGRRGKSRHRIYNSKYSGSGYVKIGVYNDQQELE